MMRVLVRIFAFVGLMTVLVIGGGITAAIIYAPKTVPLPDAIVLEFDFENPLVETTAEDPFDGLFGQQPDTLGRVVMAIDRASRDPKVKGIIAKVGNSAQGLGDTQEIRDALSRFRESGRFAIVHSQSFGEFSNGTQSYYLASAFEEIWLQPGGLLGMTGVLAQPTTFRGTLDKIGAKPMIEKRAEYKTFAETYMEKEITGPHREMLESLVGDLYDQIVAGVAAGRNLPIDAVKAAIDAAPLLDGESVERKLVDKLGYYDEAVDAALTRAGDGAETVWLMDYQARKGQPVPTPEQADAPVIAVITGEGAISRGESEPSPFEDEPTFAADTVAGYLREAIDNDAVKAIIFRVDSPGGSAIGSDVVYREIQRAREAGKKVVISMSDVAASGGYWVSMSADRIVAQPATLTGSIGVVAGKLDISGTTDMLGINVESISRGSNAGIWSMNGGYTSSEQKRLSAMLDDIYGRFTKSVAAGRNLPLEKVQEIAKGRVWTGRQALQVGLVDALGGMDVAKAETRKLLDLPEKSLIKIMFFPTPKTQIEKLMELFNKDGRTAAMRAMTKAQLAEYKPMLDLVAPVMKAALKPEEQILAMPELGVAGY